MRPPGNPTRSCDSPIRSDAASAVSPGIPSSPRKIARDASRTPQPPSSWRMVGQGGVWPFGIVMVEPGRQGGVALPRGRIGPGIGPLAQAGLNEPLGLAVGARRVRPGAFVSEPSGRQRRPESLAEIGRTVIGHDPFDGHPLPGKPAEGALEKADRAALALVRQDLAVSQPGRVIDAHMQRFPADAVMAIDHAARSAGDAMPDPGDTPKLLGIEMDQLAGPLALVSYHRRLRVERGQLAQTEPAQVAPTVETGMLSCRAIAGPLIRCRRKSSISPTRSVPMRCLQHCGAELRSASAATPPLRYRASQR